MGLSFLTPVGAVVAILGLVPLAAFAVRERRARAVRTAIGVPGPPWPGRAAIAAAIVAVTGLLALAAAQPVMATDRIVQERKDAQLLVVVDTSRSMLAAAGPGTPTRFERAVEIAQELQLAISDVPMGVASLTDRILPHVFPTSDGAVVSAALERSVEVERPPPSAFYPARATSLSPLARVPDLGYFSPAARKRLMVVLTDGEMRDDAAELAGLPGDPRVDTVFVRVWGEGEQIYETGVAEAGYRSDPDSAAQLEAVAATIEARVIDERAVDDAAAAAREALGEGPTVPRVLKGERRALMPYVTAAAFLPLAFLLWRRNL